MNNYTESFQKISKKSKSYDNTEQRKGAVSSSKEISCKQDCKQSYKHIRSMKREWALSIHSTTLSTDHET